MDNKKARDLLERERDRLRQLKESNAANAELGEGQQGSLGELSSIDQHPADIASDTFERSKALAVEEQFDRQLDQIGAAMERLDDGSFGHCVECGKEIGAERLEAVPATEYCAEHQPKNTPDS
jgi:DnaK suppressor protein